MMNEPAPKKRDPRALNAYRHGLTGQIHLLTPADQVAYEKHCKNIHQSLAPVGGLETDLAQAVADDRWRLNRAAGIEGSIFAIGTPHPEEDSRNNPEVDVAIAQARTWLADGKSIQLLSLYEHRIQRHVEKNIAMLRELQQERKAALEQVVEEVADLIELAETQGVTFDIERDYPRGVVPPQFDFSNALILRFVSHRRRLKDTKRFFTPAGKPLAEAA
ncbi:MAG: hypothetical protein ACLQVN_21840 [Bryobacteraceae bacterium]